jgi:hypothetical protein
MRGKRQLSFYAMRTLCKTFAPVLLFCTLASPGVRAQSVKPFFWHLDLSGDYSFIRTNFTGSGGEFNLNGGSGSLNYNLNPRFSIIGEFGAYRFGGLPTGLNSTMYTYMFGPRYTIRHFAFGTPFAQALVGGGRLNASSGGIQAGENGLAAAFGGGLDLSLTHQFSIRVIEADYLLTRFPQASGNTATQNNVRISAGIIFHFAER